MIRSVIFLGLLCTCFSVTTLGCAYLGTGSCDTEGSLCSYGCHKNYCWKQCLTDLDECVVDHVGYTMAVKEDGKGPISCTSDEDCLDDIDFKKAGSRCYFKDYLW